VILPKGWRGYADRIGELVASWRGMGTSLGNVGIGDCLYLASASSENADMASGTGKR
jgi:hypothetical protein